ncbi:SDR family NAD(P)-dependent oxidoreductase [Tsukamurella sp. 8F]|uniref:SDR family NAD(P)-dependent oxidoreductase n=1 Tax=unclassified Tsukamurella TaxID=2633480 RepID=UPI0023BA1B46|nr:MULTISPECIES: SDR family NAD(P)-dependent oxidoreductase [unclassified Tsukamurella]MDF0529537.1 SDR family NAD(P)-dependent oxidoreductase [Tsukamurella sp. 8J]MDF0585775.1 SDR family NAD(P)-dependent oxidoreductase [Tsukamurella sp. 8F]
MAAVLVTGAGSGFGLGAATALAAAGHRVFAAVERDEQIATTRAALAENGQHAEVLRLDLLDDDDIARAARLEATVLINNAGTGAEGPILLTDIEAVRHTFDVNVFGTLKLTQLFTRRMISAGRQGRIVFVTSVAGLFVAPGAGAYGASKHALEVVARASYQELLPHGIDVRVVEPGPFRTGFNERLIERAPQSDHDFSDFLANQIDPQGCIDTIVRVATGDSRYRTIVPASMKSRIVEYQDLLWAQTDVALEGDQR